MTIVIQMQDDDEYNPDRQAPGIKNRFCMGHSKAEKAESHDRIVKVASERFREVGVDGIGVADLMQEAGLTHGGFYGHFDSKEELMGIACARALSESLARWHQRAESGAPLKAVAKSYLSIRHPDDPGTGCALPALATDVARHGAPVRRAFTEG